MHFIDDNLLEYATRHSEPEPDLLKALAKETHQKILQPRMLSSALQGRLLSLIAKLIQPKKILEIGTFTGYATLCLAEGLQPNGQLHTIDYNEELVTIQNKYFEKSPYGENIRQHLGDAINLIPKLEGSFDLVFLDADKKNYLNYFDLLLPKMNKGGLLLSDNVLWSGKVLQQAEAKDEETMNLQKFNIKLREDKRVSSVLLPFRDGLTISRKL